ncbi:SAP domain-containing protein [Dendryphion nanum]|uniref:SAP domain-containing protein n=1 Tax=Dendryphion nanum TaxID=256645 RepID=A0A9P9IFA5_9PLEO|nr:SAP domain-containing protein [Dendryphion nanum]
MTTDYSKLTVANLRQLLKDRGIPSTGLTRKAQIIEKLEEHDSANNAAPVELSVGSQTPDKAQDDTAAVEPQEANATNARMYIPLWLNRDTAPDAPPEPQPDVESNTTSRDVGTDAATSPKRAQTPPNLGETQNAPVESTQLREELSKGQLEEPLEEPSEEPLEEPLEEPTSILESGPGLNEAPQLVESDAQTQNFATNLPRTASPDPNEKFSIEKPELLPIPERSADTSMEVSRMNSEEMEADSKKRKRRSQSPDLSIQEIKSKKPRSSEDAVLLKEDQDIVMDQRPPGPDKILENDGEIEDQKGHETKEGETPLDAGVHSQITEKKEKDARYREAFTKAIPRTTEPSSSTDPATDDRPIIPALHAATPALYIKDFMRPLRPELLRTHLISLASPPSSSPDSSVLESLYLDPMRTHALVLFTNTTAASRVRSSLNGVKWPSEGQRKELWVDFVPSDKVLSWIQEEEDATVAEKESRAAGRPIAAKRFEVIYPESDDGSIRAIFQEVGAHLTTPFNPPRGPRSNIEHRRTHAPTALSGLQHEETRKDLGKSFQTLDQLFKSTTAKPKLYYLPVSEKISERRLNELHDVTSRDWRPEDKVRGRGAGANRLDEKVRFSFGDEERVVEVGEDSNYVGRGGRGGRGRGGGGFRGGRGDWRGGRGGIGFRSERRYD